MDPQTFRNLFGTLHDMNRWDLEEAGVIKAGAVGGSDWTRFNNNLTTFVLKLPQDRLAKLAALVTIKMLEPVP